jgi:hypothetical protein
MVIYYSGLNKTLLVHRTSYPHVEYGAANATPHGVAQQGAAYIRMMEHCQNAACSQNERKR